MSMSDDTVSDYRQYIGSNSAVRRYLLPDTASVTDELSGSR